MLTAASIFFIAFLFAFLAVLAIVTIVLGFVSVGYTIVAETSRGGTYLGGPN